MKGIRGGLVCKELDHNANQKNSKEDVPAEIKELKMKQPTARITEEDKAYIADIFKAEIDGEDE